jgi:flagellar motor switch protein FliM
MERLCREIFASHEQRQALLEELKSSALRLSTETRQRLQDFRRQSETLREDLRAARAVWRKASRALATKRRNAKRGAE